MFSSPLPCLAGAAVCPCQRRHRGHGGSHPEDMSEHQWPQTRGEQQPRSAHLPSGSEWRRRRACDASHCFFFFSHLCSTSLSTKPCQRIFSAHSSCFLLCLYQPRLLPHALQFNVWFLLQLHKVAVSRASDLLKVHGEQLPLRALKAAGAEGNLEAVAEYSRTLTEQKEQLVEVRRGQGSR